MACCKAEEFRNWCKDEETFVWEEKEYCIFHAPAECPEKRDVDGFNERVFARIDEFKKRQEGREGEERKGKVLDFSRTIFPGDITFSQYGRENPLPGLSFADAFFVGLSFFRDVTFGGDANFQRSAFDSISDFTGATLTCRLVFRDATFREGALFGKVIFNKEADFYQASFKVVADFHNAVFKGVANFGYAVFNDFALFARAMFNGVTTFSNAVFNCYSTFILATCAGETSFSQTTFNEQANFMAVKFDEKAYFEGTTFKKEAHFAGSIFAVGVTFCDSSFAGYCIFDVADLGPAQFIRTSFRYPAFFRSTRFGNSQFYGCYISERLEISSTDLFHVSFLQSPIEDLRFINCKWPTYKGRNIVWDARQAQKKMKEGVASQYGQVIGYFPLDGVANPEPLDSEPDPGTLADLFRRLKKVAQTEQDQALASDWHYAQKEMERIDNWRKAGVPAGHIGCVLEPDWWERLRGKLTNTGQGRWKAAGLASVLQLYKLISGYGESPGRAAACLLAFVLLPLLFFPDDLSFLPFVKTSPPDNPGFWLPLSSAFWRLLITVQAGFLGFALRNKFRR